MDKELSCAKKYHDNPVHNFFVKRTQGRDTWGVFENDVSSVLTMWDLRLLVLTIYPSSLAAMRQYCYGTIVTASSTGAGYVLPPFMKCATSGTECLPCPSGRAPLAVPLYSPADPQGGLTPRFMSLQGLLRAAKPPCV